MRGWGEDGDTNNTQVMGRGWGQHIEKDAGTGWRWSIRHIEWGGSGVKSLSPCHSLFQILGTNHAQTTANVENKCGNNDDDDDVQVLMCT